ncbi:hypothetical protein L6452_13531 [Arctium lappa]|uniref:Uncharacterized protein n=1 Tax=Arctium lappa TaxID=4217 RepID=A0ACB9CIK5_ARCLA|nr:hypothetical protein L6452_13531 [Arctium lappa]
MFDNDANINAPATADGSRDLASNCNPFNEPQCASKMLTEGATSATTLSFDVLYPSLALVGLLTLSLLLRNILKRTIFVDSTSSLDVLKAAKQYKLFQVKVPGFKLDLRDEHYPMSLEQVMAPIMQHFREIETCIGCSATNLVLVCDYVQL